jgi:hypothetical protein
MTQAFGSVFNPWRKFSLYVTDMKNQFLFAPREASWSAAALRRSFEAVRANAPTRQDIHRIKSSSHLCFWKKRSLFLGLQKIVQFGPRTCIK